MALITSSIGTVDGSVRRVRDHGARSAVPKV